jgi:hypothetical protein
MGPQRDHRNAGRQNHAIGAAVHRGMASEAVETVYAIAFAEALPKLMPAHLGFPSAKRAIEAIR